MDHAYPSEIWIGRWWALGFAVAAWLVLMLAAGNNGIRQLTRIAPDRIWVLDPGMQNQARRVEAAPHRVPLTGQFGWDSGAARQFHLRLKAGEAGNGDLAVLAPIVGGAIKLYVNSVGVAEGQAAIAYGGPGFGRATLAGRLPATFLNLGDNRIDFIVANDRPHAGIRALYIGPVNAVRQVAVATSQRTKWLQRAAQVAAFLALLCAAVMAALRGAGLRSAASAMIAGALVCALLASSLPTWPITQLSAALGLIGSGLSLRVWCNPQGWVVRINLGLALAATVSALLGGLLVFTPLILSAPFETALIANGGVILLGMIAIPLAMIEDLRQLYRRFRRAAIDLAEKDRVIGQQKVLLEEQIRTAAVLEERQRFTRDMHDGIGGQLQSLLMRVRSNRIGQNDIAGEIQKGLTDLRLVVDSLDAIETDLYAALETFHVRVSQQVEAGGVRLDWHLAQDVRAVRVEAREVLNIYRILQESVTNCLRHAQAQRLIIAITTDPSGTLLSLLIEDDGLGFDPGQVKAGKGLTGLRQRCAKMSGTMEIEPGEHGKGTRITARLRLTQSAAS